MQYLEKQKLHNKGIYSLKLRLIEAGFLEEAYNLAISMKKHKRLELYKESLNSNNKINIFHHTSTEAYTFH